MNRRTSSSKGSKPLALQCIDSEINHLERVLRHALAHDVFGRAYWHGRIMHLNATPGLTPEQKLRIQHLLDILNDNTP